MIWTHKGKKVESVDQMPKEAIGFIYKVTNIKTGKFYIGRKVVSNTRKTRISKREKAQTGTRKTFKYVTKESDWKTYTGSSKELSADIKKAKGNFKKEILEYCCNKKYLAYAELSHQIKNDVLKGNSYNGNILGRYYRRDMENC
jgi:hypothetical protein